MTNNQIKSIKDAQEEVDAIIQKFGGYWSPLSQLASVIEEIGELARLINSIEGYKPKKDEESPQNIEEEISDALFSLICLANYFDIDMAKGLENVIKKYYKRDNNRFNLTK